MTASTNDSGGDLYFCDGCGKLFPANMLDESEDEDFFCQDCIEGQDDFDEDDEEYWEPTCGPIVDPLWFDEEE